MMMTMTVLNKHVDATDCCLISIILGVTTKKSPNNRVLSNICEYHPVPNNQYRSNRTCQ